MNEISICMGSSCFSRGNNESIEIIKKFIENRADEYKMVTLVGNLCQNNCSKGPNIIINGKPYHNVMPENVVDILEIYLEKE